VAVTLGGLEGLVLMAGIGEHQSQIRTMVARHLGWLGLEPDAAGDVWNAIVVHSTRSLLAACAIPADEEQVISNETLRYYGLRAKPGCKAYVGAGASHDDLRNECHAIRSFAGAEQTAIPAEK